jgi:surfactin synthase thioesterase subunit
MKDYRARLRRQGLRPVQIWVPDQRAPRFMEELKRQVNNLNQQDEKETLELLERIADWPEE